MTGRLRRWLALRLLWALGVRTWSDARAIAGHAVRTPAPGFESFERAFDPRVCGCRAVCRCGREFWDSYNSGYDWYEGEREALIASPNATAVPYSVGYVEFEGSTECLDIQEALGVHYLEAMRISELADQEREAAPAGRATERAAAALAHTVEQWAADDDIPF